MPRENKSRFELSPRALDAWNPSLRAAVENTDNTITIYGVIGDDGWYGEGVTLNRIDAALRYIGDKPVTVYINSPGGDMFEGIAIYNRLIEHSQEITVKVIGIAASAASIVAMAGSERLVARSAFLMIHNCWSYFVGNRHDLRAIADQLEEFDKAMCGVYVDTCELDDETVQAMLDAETYLSGNTAVEKGFATGILDGSEVRTATDEPAAQANAMRQLDAALAKSGMPRSERRKLLAELKPSTASQQPAGGDMPSAVAPSTHNATELDPSSFDETLNIAATLRNALTN